MTEQVATLEAKLREKEQLVAALTKQLEKAAEQLDRTQRTGGSRTVKVAGGGMPAELVQKQQTVLDDLTHVVQQWEEMQCGPTLGRVEVLVTELRDLVANELARGGFGGSAGYPGAPHHQGDGGAGHGRTSGAPTASGLTGYEAMKAGLLAEDSNVEPTLADAGTQQAPAVVSAPPPPEEVFIPLADAPEPVDFENADADALKDAITKRESYISYLIGRLRSLQSRRHTPINWAELNAAPEELKQRLEHLEAQLNETLRMAEVDVSLERARLGREAIRLEQLELHVQRQAERAGISDFGEGEHEVVGDVDDRADEEETGIAGRWNRLFGKRK